MTSNQIKCIIALIHQPRGAQNQSRVARVLGINKSTVNRAVSEAISQGVIKESEDGYELTGYGIEYITNYEHKIERISGWLRSQGVDAEKAREDSFAIIEGCSGTTLDVLQNRGNISDIHTKLKNIKGITGFSGEEIVKYMDEREYIVPFIFYHSDVSAKKNPKKIILQISMANEAFFHPAVLTVSKAGSNICIRTKRMKKKSKVMGQKMEGILKSMKYERNGREEIVVLNDEKVYIPLEVMQFLYSKESDMLQGYMELKMTCSVGEEHMPESKAVLIVSI